MRCVEERPRHDAPDVSQWHIVELNIRSQTGPNIKQTAPNPTLLRRTPKLEGEESSSYLSTVKYIFSSRFMVATRNLEPGDIILREKAAVVGPSLEQSRPVCLGSAGPLVRNFHLCSSCQAPLCSKLCEKHPLHVDECKYVRF